MIRGRRHKAKTGGEAGGGGEPRGEYIEIDASQISGLISVPDWLRNAGLMSWLLLGIGLLLGAAVWLAAMTQVIVVPVIVAAIVAAVGSPLVAWLDSHGVPRPLGSVLLLLAIVGVAVGMLLTVVLGITGQATDVSGHLNDAKDTITGWAQDLGLNPDKAKRASDTGAQGTTDAVSSLLDGVAKGIAGLSSLAFFLAMTLLSLFFLLKDAPTIRGWAEGHLGVPEPVAKVISHRVIGSLRGYFLGVTIVAAFNAVVVTIGCLILGVPLIGTIAAVTFIGAYIPYLGAWAAAAFAVLIALGDGGPSVAGGMVVVELLANGILQQLVQPFAMGAALGIHPLAVLIVTIAGGALFGTLGLILAAPLTSALTRISTDLARAKEAEAAKLAGTGTGTGTGMGPEPAPGAT